MHLANHADTKVRSFAELGLIAPLLAALRDTGYTEPTPIQDQAIPRILEGRDLLGCAQTGTGKTAAFALPILQQLMERPSQKKPGAPRALVLAPTRELAAQIGEGFAEYGRHSGLRFAVVFGGVGYDAQRRALKGGLDVLVATPGRLWDHLEQRTASLDRVEHFVLDEADRMLDVGFLPVIKRMLKLLPRERRSLLFSATMPAELEPIVRDMLREPVKVSVAPVASTPDAVEQQVYRVDSKQKRALLLHLLGDSTVTRALVFTRTKHGANRVAEGLDAAGVRAEAIHGNKSQNARERALKLFKDGSLRALVATDIAARGIDVDDVSHVFNFDIPHEPESYVHRIGRTARAGRSGKAIAFCCADEARDLQQIERLIRRRIPVVDGGPILSTLPPAPELAPRDSDHRPGAGRGDPRGRGSSAPRPARVGDGWSPSSAAPRSPQGARTAELGRTPRGGYTASPGGQSAARRGRFGSR